MPRYARNLGYIGIGKQTAKGSAVAPTHFVRYSDETDMTPEQDVTLHRLGGGGQYPVLALKERVMPNGTFSTFAFPDVTGLLFTLLLGTDTVSGTGPYTHTIKPGSASTQPWATIERDVAGVLRTRTVDCRIQSITVRGEAGRPIVLEVAYLGIDEVEQATATTESYETDAPFVFWQGTYQLDGAAITGAIREFELTISNIFDEEDFAAQVIREDIPLIGRQIEGTVRIAFETKDAYAKAFWGSATGNRLSRDVFTGGSINISQTYGSGAAQRSLTINVPQIAYVRSAVELDPAEESSQEYEISFQGLKGASDFVTVTVVNGRSTAY